MSVSKNLEVAVSSRNIQNIRGCLRSCIMVDPSMSKEFAESESYVLSNGIKENELYEIDKGGFSEEQTEDNMSKLVGLLHLNFSKEKIDALKKIGHALYPPVPEEKKSPETGRHPQQDIQTNWKTIRIVAGIIIAAVLIGTGIWKCSQSGNDAQGRTHQIRNFETRRNK